MRDSSIASHPICIFVGTWAFVFLLYSLSLSGQLIYRASDFSYLFVCIAGPFLVGYWYVNRLLTLASRAGPSSPPRSAPPAGALELDSRRLIWRRTVGMLKIWSAITLVEIVWSGGLPIIWLFTGSSKTYQDFGI